MYIKDLETGRVRKYGSNRHDSLVISQDGRRLSYYNLQNGDGSRWGSYRFCDDEVHTPMEDETLAKYGADAYFNIGGWRDEEPAELIETELPEIKICGRCHTPWITTPLTEGAVFSYCPGCGAPLKRGEK